MRLTGIIFWIIGVGILAVGGFILVREKLFQSSAAQTMAVVTDNTQYTYTGSVNEYGVQHFYCTSFKFQTQGGQSISFKEDDSSNNSCADLDMPPEYQVGDQVPVYYDPHDPINTVQLPKGEQQIYAGGVIVIVVGFIGTVIGMLLFWLGLRRDRKAVTPRMETRRR